MVATETRFWWVRHAPIEAAHAGQINGQLDVGVDLSEKSHLAAVSRTLPRDAVWVTSALSRTHKTAAAIGAPAAPAATTEADLNEQHFGDWQGLSWGDVANLPGNDAFWDHAGGLAPPGGESFADQIVRVGAVVLRLAQTHAGRDIVIVAHAGTIRAALAQALELDPDRALAFDIAPLSLTRIDHFAGETRPHRSGGWRVGGVNHRMA